MTRSAPKSAIDEARNELKRFLWFEALIISLITLAIYTIIGFKPAYSAFLGGIVCLLPTWYFAWRAFRYTGAHAAQRIVGAFYMGEAVKLLFTMLLFALVFIFVDIKAIPFFGMFIGAQMLVWLAPFVFKSTSRK